MSGARGPKVLFWYMFSYAKGENWGQGTWPPRPPGSATALLYCNIMFCLNHNAKTWLLIKYLLLITINLYTCFKYKSQTQNDLCPWSNAGLYIALRTSMINHWLALRWCYAYIHALGTISLCGRASVSQICFLGVVLTSQCYISPFTIF